MESIYEYGARAGFWRLWRLFTQRAIPVTVYGVATALQRGPEQVAAMREAGWEIASHGLKWIEYKDFTREREQAHMAEAIAIHTAVTGERPQGWYTGRCSMRTLDLVMEEGLPLFVRQLCRRPALLGDGLRTGRIWSCPTRSTPTTCASRRPRASIRATSSSPT